MASAAVMHTDILTARRRLNWGEAWALRLQAVTRFTGDG